MTTFKLGVVVPEKGGDPFLNETEFALAFTDTDNEEVHLFKVERQQWKHYVSLVDQSLLGQRIEVAGPQDIPRGAA